MFRVGEGWLSQAIDGLVWVQPTERLFAINYRVSEERPDCGLQGGLCFRIPRSG